MVDVSSPQLLVFTQLICTMWISVLCPRFRDLVILPRHLTRGLQCVVFWIMICITSSFMCLKSLVRNTRDLQVWLTTGVSKNHVYMFIISTCPRPCVLTYNYSFLKTTSILRTRHSHVLLRSLVTLNQFKISCSSNGGSNRIENNSCLEILLLLSKSRVLWRIPVKRFDFSYMCDYYNGNSPHRGTVEMNH